MSIRPKCKVHGVPMVCFCPACRGSQTSEAKARSSRENGKRGGRPPKGNLRKSKGGSPHGTL